MPNRVRDDEPTCTHRGSAVVSFTDTVESLEQLPRAQFKKWLSNKITMLVLSLALLTVAPTLGYFLLQSGAKSVDRSVDSFVKGEATRPGDLGGHVVRAVDAGKNGIGLMIFLALVAGGTILGLACTVYSVLSLSIGPPKASKSARKSVNQFFSNALFSDRASLWSVKYSAMLPAFVCLSAKTRQDAETFEKFCRYWSNVRNEFKGSNTRLWASIGSVSAKSSSPTTSDYEVTIKCESFQEDANGKHWHSRADDYEASGQMVRVGARWYITDIHGPVKKAKATGVGTIAR